MRNAGSKNRLLQIHAGALPRIACIHQGYELYGSDRSFIESVAALRGAFPSADIEVVLPRDGPIVSLLERHATRVVFEPLWILRRQAILRLATLEIARLPVALWRALRRLKGRDLVYVNTSVVADYALAARWFPRKTLLHIHEIPEGATLRVLRMLTRWSRAELIFNSRATRAAFGDPEGVCTHVIYNGLSGPAAVEPLTYDARRPLRLLMLGRINRIKGQEVLLEAVASMPRPMRDRIEIRLVGSAFENDERERALAELVKALQLDATVSVYPFVADPSHHYRWADIVAVPSKRPESLGRIAIEAMAFGRPPLVSAIGGLVEVVEDGKTGWLVPPGDVSALAQKLQENIVDPGSGRRFGAAGRQRYEALFSEAAAAEALAAVALDKLHGIPHALALNAGGDR